MKRIATALIFIILLFTAGRADYNKEVKLEPLLKTDTTSGGQKIIYPNSENNEVTIVKVTIPSGKTTGWHKHAFPVFAYVLKGTVTVELENGKTHQFTENSSFAEVIDTFHNGKNEGRGDAVLLAFFIGEKGKPLSIRRDAK
jgi:quercetin dioxygenase-like cupin family protein